MKPDLDSRRLGAFVDGELDLSAHLDIEQRLAHDDELRGRVDSLNRLRDALKDSADYHPAPSALRSRLAALAPARVPLALGPAPAPKRWLPWQPMLGSFAVAAMLAIVVIAGPWRVMHNGVIDESGLADEVVASHVRSTLGEHLLDVPSSDHHTVKPWLSSKLDFSPPVRELPLEGSALLGGRIDYLDGRPVAALVYRQGRHIVNAFVWPTSGGEQSVRRTTERGFQLAHWSHAGWKHWVVSDVNADEFAAVVNELQSADGNDGAKPASAPQRP